MQVLINVGNMKRSLIISLLLILILSVGVQAAKYVPHQVVARFDSDKPLVKFLDDYDGYVIDSIEGCRIYLIYLQDSIIVQSLLEKMPTDAGIEYVQANYIWGLPEVEQISQSFPDENHPVFLMGTSPQNFYGQTGLDMIGLDSVHQITTGEEITVAVIDNGIYLEHPLFDGYIVNTLAYDFIDEDNDPSEELGQAYGHGTFVSGLIKLIAPGCNILPLRAFDNNGFGNSFLIAKAIYYAVRKDADLINMSFSTSMLDRVMQSACQFALLSNIPAIAATGNDGMNISTYPAAIPSVIAVNAIDTLGYRAGFSNYGSHLDVCAPGVNVYSALTGDYEWGNWSGTSFAAPMVSAAVALIKSVRPSGTSHFITRIIRKSANRQFPWGSTIPADPEYGFGCVDIYASLILALRSEVSMEMNMEAETHDAISLIRLLYRDGISDEPESFDYDNSGQVNILDIIYILEQRPPIVDQRH